MDTRIYVMTHKKIEPIENDIYIPLHVGRHGKESLGYIGDDTGESISEKNSNYCELTGLYWLWKNVDCDIIGVCHYRRFFTRHEQILDREYIENTLHIYDAIIPDSRCSAEGNVKLHYGARHMIEDLMLCGEVIGEIYPEYNNAFEIVMNANLISVGNMWITRKEIFDKYCQWLFDILFEVEKRIDFSKYDEYQGRVMGFLSERLFRVWLIMQEYNIREEYVKMIETKDFLNDMKQTELKYQYIKTTLKPLIQLYETGNISTKKSLAQEIEQKDDFEGKVPVWVCWWQGEEAAPELVKVCINSIRRNIPEDKAIIRLITFNNCMDYVTFTDTVIKKFNEGKITLTHLSDMLRAELLYRYGGMWIDATYYVTDKIDETIFDKNVFYTLRYAESLWKSDVSKGRWSCNLLRMSPKTLFARFLMEGLWLYWEMNDSLIDYFWMDDIISIEYEMFETVRNDINACQIADTAVFELQKNLNRKFDEQKYKEWTSKTSFFKLNWRRELEERTLTQNETFWKYIKDKQESIR